MTQEQKAKAYDKAIDKVAHFIKKHIGFGCIIHPNSSEAKELFNIFPELVESEDEKIRKAIICGMNALKEQHKTHFASIPINDCIAWLEKQNENKPFDYENCNIQQKDFAPKSALDAMKEEKVNNTNKVEPKDYSSIDPHFFKTTDKEEPKFKVGDWVVSKLDGKARQISEVHYDEYNDYYVVEGYEHNIEEYDRLHHLWSIEDAKDGDVLFQDLMDGKTFIYNGTNHDKAILYSFIISNDGKDVLPYHIGKPNTGIGYIEEHKNIIHPATKEQRDLLFQKMKEAGYEWDEMKKELKKLNCSSTKQ